MITKINVGTYTLCKLLTQMKDKRFCIVCKPLV